MTLHIQEVKGQHQIIMLPKNTITQEQKGSLWPYFTFGQVLVLPRTSVNTFY